MLVKNPNFGISRQNSNFPIYVIFLNKLHFCCCLFKKFRSGPFWFKKVLYAANFNLEQINFQHLAKHKKRVLPKNFSFCPQNFVAFSQKLLIPTGTFVDKLEAPKKQNMPKQFYRHQNVLFTDFRDIMQKYAIEIGGNPNDKSTLWEESWGWQSWTWSRVENVF